MLKTDIWPYGAGYYVVYCEDFEAMRRIASWDDCRWRAIYYFPNGAVYKDIRFPKKLYNRVADAVGLPRKKKDPRRVAAGKKLARYARETGARERGLRRAHELNRQSHKRNG